MPDLAVIIVTWNVRELVLDALDSLYRDLAGSGLNAEVLVVDSASSDGTVSAVQQRFPQVAITASDKNLGFGRANNLGLAKLGFDGSRPAAELPKAVYLLNPDTITEPGATRALYDALMADASAGLAGARLSFGDGSFQHGAFGFPGLRQLWAEFFPVPGRWLEGRFNGRYPHQLYDAGHPFEVDFTLGATMMLKREVVQQTSGFDTDFFMYCEEIDWAWRIHSAGWRVLCVPTAHVIHLGGQSTGQVRPRSTINLWESRLHLFNKHYPACKNHLARWMVRLGMQRRIAAAHQDPALNAAERGAMIHAYQTIIAMTRS